MVAMTDRQVRIACWATALICVSCSPSIAAPHPHTCPWAGSTYAPPPALASGDVTYRLKVELLPDTADSAAVATLWRFQTLDPHTGAKLSELRMYYSCANGRGPCSVSPPHRPGPTGGLYSEVVQLNGDFSLATGDQAPHALILPGFGQDEWTFVRSDLKMQDFTFFTPRFVTPDLENQLVWLISACGPA